MQLTEARAALHELGAGLPEAPGRVRLTTEGPVAALVLDNPGARGAMTLRMMVELADAVLALERFEGAAVVLSSSDPTAFCSGGHLRQVRQAISDGERAATMARAMTTVLGALRDLPVVSVAAVRGHAIGGGAELATACDVRVLGDGAAIHFVHARLGIAPGWGGAGRLVGIVGRRQALRVLLAAEPIGAGEALAIGLADLVDADPLAAAERLAAEWRNLPVEAVRAVKRQVVAADRGLPEEEVAAFAEVWGGPAHLAALAALRKHAG